MDDHDDQTPPRRTFIMQYIDDRGHVVTICPPAYADGIPPTRSAVPQGGDEESED